MKSDLAILYENVLKTDKAKRLVMARGGILRLYAFMTYRGLTMPTRMALIDMFAHCPLAIDGPINEEELEFLKAALSNDLDLERANERVKELNEGLDAHKNMLSLLAKLSEIGEEEVKASLLKAVFIGLLSDSGDDINEIEEKYFEELLFYKGEN